MPIFFRFFNMFISPMFLLPWFFTAELGPVSMPGWSWGGGIPTRACWRQSIAWRRCQRISALSILDEKSGGFLYVVGGSPRKNLHDLPKNHRFWLPQVRKPPSGFAEWGFHHRWSESGETPSGYGGDFQIWIDLDLLSDWVLAWFSPLMEMNLGISKSGSHT